MELLGGKGCCTIAIDTANRRCVGTSGSAAQEAETGELAVCNTLANTIHNKTTYARDPQRPPPGQNDPHNLRRLRRPTGPRRAALC